MIPLNVNEYSKESIPEETINHFNNTDSIKIWLETIKIPNIIRNTIKFLLGKDKYESRSVSWGAGNTPGYISYLIKEAMSPSGDTEIILRQQVGWGEVNAKVIWELFILKPLTGHDYLVTFTRMPNL